MFYEMLAGLEEGQLDMLQLDSMTKYQLLYPGNAQPALRDSREMKRNEQNFILLRQALKIIGLESREFEIFEILAALIHLGQVEFDGGEETSMLGAEGGAVPFEHPTLQVVNRENLDQAADLLGLEDDRLAGVLLVREVGETEASHRPNSGNRLLEPSRYVVCCKPSLKFVKEFLRFSLSRQGH